MRLVVDAQALQSKGSRHRGIGRYSLALLQEMAQQADGHEIILLLNGLYADTLDPIRDSFRGVIPDENFRIWRPLALCGALESSGPGRRQTSELIRESVIASLNPDVVLVMSLFEGLDESIIASIGRHKGNFPIAVILYDIIPYIFKEKYLENTRVNSWYQNKIDDLRRSDLILSISECTKNDASKLLKISQDIIFNISGSVPDYFRPDKIDYKTRKEIEARIGIDRPFIMYTGGGDHRKNVDGLIEAFISLPIHLREMHQLVIVCFLDDLYMHKISNLIANSDLNPNDVVLTGRVSDRDLLNLYQICKLFVFPSIYEGFGLPALEAMRCGVAVIASNTSSLPEILANEAALFDPTSRAAITTSMQKVLEDEHLRLSLAAQGLERSQDFSWERSARVAWTALAGLIEQRPTAPAVMQPKYRNRLAFISPLPPVRSGIAKYSTDILPELSRFYDIDLIVDQNDVSDPWAIGSARIRSAYWLRQNYHKIDRFLYQFGNSTFHQYMFDLLRDIPGTSVLHDFGFGSLRAHLEQTGEQPRLWNEVLEQSHGWRALYDRHHSTDDENSAIWLPVNFDVIQQSDGIIVHSNYAKEMAKRYYGNTAYSKFQTVPFPIAKSNYLERNQARLSLSWKDDEIIICCFGFIAASKLNHFVLEAWLSSEILQNSQSRLIFVGKAEYDYGIDFLEKVSNCGFSDRISVTGWIDDVSYRNHLAGADFAVQLRGNSRGESSAAVFDCLMVGLPVILNAQGSFSELPDEAVVKLPGAVCVGGVRAAMERLASDPIERHRLSEVSSRLAAEQHSPAHTAMAYRDAIERFHEEAQNGASGIIGALKRIPDLQGSPEERDELARAIAVSYPPLVPHRRIWLDVTTLEALSHTKQLNLLARIMLEAPQGWKIEPIEQDTRGGWIRSTRFIEEALDVPWVAALVPEPNERDLIIVGHQATPELLQPLCEGGGRVMKWGGPNEPLPYPP